MLIIMLVYSDGSGCLTRPTLSNFPQGTRRSWAHLFPSWRVLGRMEPGILLSMVSLSTGKPFFLSIDTQTKAAAQARHPRSNDRKRQFPPDSHLGTRKSTGQRGGQCPLHKTH